MPITSVTCFIVGLGIFRRVSQPDLIFWIFASVGVTIILIESRTNPKNVNCWVGTKTDLSGWMKNPSLVNNGPYLQRFVDSPQQYPLGDKNHQCSPNLSDPCCEV